MKNKELWVFVVLLGLAAAAMFFMLRPRPMAQSVPPPPMAKAPAVVPIQDRKTIDFSSGKPVVKDDAEEHAAIAKAEKEMAAAAQGVTFGPKKEPPPKE